jgi:hypothetical protein
MLSLSSILLLSVCVIAIMVAVLRYAQLRDAQEAEEKRCLAKTALYSAYELSLKSQAEGLLGGDYQIALHVPARQLLRPDPSQDESLSEATRIDLRSMVADMVVVERRRMKPLCVIMTKRDYPSVHDQAFVQWCERAGLEVFWMTDADMATVNAWVKVKQVIAAQLASQAGKPVMRRLEKVKDNHLRKEQEAVEQEANGKGDVGYRSLRRPPVAVRKDVRGSGYRHGSKNKVEVTDDLILEDQEQEDDVYV